MTIFSCTCLCVCACVCRLNFYAGAFISCVLSIASAVPSCMQLVQLYYTVVIDIIVVIRFEPHTNTHTKLQTIQRDKVGKEFHGKHCEYLNIVNVEIENVARASAQKANFNSNKRNGTTTKNCENETDYKAT